MAHLPGTHPTRGAYFTAAPRATAYARLSEGPVPTTSTTWSGCGESSKAAATLVPQPVRSRRPVKTTRFGVIYFGSTSPAMDEALDRSRTGVHPRRRDAVRAFPFPDSCRTSSPHEHVFVVEQNRDAQRAPARQRTRHSTRPGRVLHYDGTPITARFIVPGDPPRPCGLEEGRAPRARPHDLYRQTRAAPPQRWHQEQGRLHAPRLRGPHLHAVRRLRPRSDHAAIIQACWELDIEPHRVAKLSGIGCSSKTPDYFLGASHGFNTVHGRMPSVLTGANLANRELLYLGVSGDGDSASIGFGQFAHAMRRGVRMAYIVENNGVYGLTKGQFSATADRAAKTRRAWSTTTARSTWSAWRCSWAPPTSRAASRRQGAAGAADHQGAP